MGVIAQGIPRGCQGLFTPVSLGYPLSVFNKNSTLKGQKSENSQKKSFHFLSCHALRLPTDLEQCPSPPPRPL